MHIYIMLFKCLLYYSKYIVIFVTNAQSIFVFQCFIWLVQKIFVLTRMNYGKTITVHCVRCIICECFKGYQYICNLSSEKNTGFQMCLNSLFAKMNAGGYLGILGHCVYAI